MHGAICVSVRARTRTKGHRHIRAELRARPLHRRRGRRRRDVVVVVAVVSVGQPVAELQRANKSLNMLASYAKTFLLCTHVEPVPHTGASTVRTGAFWLILVIFIKDMIRPSQ